MNIIYSKVLTSRFNSFADTKDNKDTIRSKKFTYPQQSNITFNYGNFNVEPVFDIRPIREPNATPKES